MACSFNQNGGREEFVEKTVPGNGLGKDVSRYPRAILCTKLLRITKAF
ncbi:MAG: hypothetical protein L3J59_07755 [Methylococcaceae bacterium]|nr:hypothetical protein [Methylococcaceae bacterium]